LYARRGIRSRRRSREIQPTTTAGVAALLAHAVEHVRTGSAWLDYYIFENEADKKPRVSWETMLHRKLARSLLNIAA